MWTVVLSWMIPPKRLTTVLKLAVSVFRTRAGGISTGAASVGTATGGLAKPISTRR
jgi:hypothetical protein